MTVIRPPKLMRAGSLQRAVLLVDRGVKVLRVIPVPVLLAIDEKDLVLDAHLCYAVRHVTGLAAVAERTKQYGFVARACAYAALMLSPAKREYVYEHVMSLADIVRYSEGIPTTAFERYRAETFDAIQGGNRSKLLGVRPNIFVPERSTAEPRYMDHA